MAENGFVQVEQTYNVLIPMKWKDALSIAGFGINATADQNILIFERFVKLK